jgi:hypothetical protein
MFTRFLDCFKAPRDLDNDDAVWLPMVEDEPRSTHVPYNVYLNQQSYHYYFIIFYICVSTPADLQQLSTQKHQEFVKMLGLRDIKDFISL